MVGPGRCDMRTPVCGRESSRPTDPTFLDPHSAGRSYERMIVKTQAATCRNVPQFLTNTRAYKWQSK